MGLMDSVMGLVFGGGRNVIAETAEVFRVNAEADAKRSSDMQAEALSQFTAEFAARRRTWFDRLIDGLNRVPRPAMALGTLGLFVAAMVDPIWFAERMTGIALVPEPLWWLLAAIVSFYFGARHQAKGQEFQRDIATTLAAAPRVADTMEGFARMRAAGAAGQGDGAAMAVAAQKEDDDPAEEAVAVTEVDTANNPALADWVRAQA